MLRGNAVKNDGFAKIVVGFEIPEMRYVVIGVPYNLVQSPLTFVFVIVRYLAS